MFNEFTGTNPVVQEVTISDIVKMRSVTNYGSINNSITVNLSPVNIPTVVPHSTISSTSTSSSPPPIPDIRLNTDQMSCFVDIDYTQIQRKSSDVYDEREIFLKEEREALRKKLEHDLLKVCSGAHYASTTRIKSASNVTQYSTGVARVESVAQYAHDAKVSTANTVSYTSGTAHPFFIMPIEPPSRVNAGEHKDKKCLKTFSGVVAEIYCLRKQSLELVYFIDKNVTEIFRKEKGGFRSLIFLDECLERLSKIDSKYSKVVDSINLITTDNERLQLHGMLIDAFKEVNTSYSIHIPELLSEVIRRFLRYGVPSFDLDIESRIKFYDLVCKLRDFSRCYSLHYELKESQRNEQEMKEYKETIIYLRQVVRHECDAKTDANCSIN